MNQEEIIKNYFQYFEKFVESEKKSNLIKERIVVIKEDFQKILQNVTSENLIDSFSSLLRIDSELQTILSFMTSSLDMEDQEILDVSEKEKNTYYKEMMGMRLNQVPPISLIFLDELVKNKLI